MKYAMWIVAGMLVGAITPSFVGREWYKFAGGVIALLLVSASEHLT